MDRLNINYPGRCEYEHPEGKYVRYEDVKELQDHIKTLYRDYTRLEGLLEENGIEDPLPKLHLAIYNAPKGVR